MVTEHLIKEVTSWVSLSSLGGPAPICHLKSVSPFLWHILAPLLSGPITTSLSEVTARQQKAAVPGVNKAWCSQTRFVLVGEGSTSTGLLSISGEMGWELKVETGRAGGVRIKQLF